MTQKQEGGIEMKMNHLKPIMLTVSGTDRFEWNTTMHSPIIGINFNW